MHGNNSGVLLSSVLKYIVGIHSTGGRRWVVFRVNHGVCAICGHLCWVFVLGLRFFFCAELGADHFAGCGSPAAGAAPAAVQQWIQQLHGNQTAKGEPPSVDMCQLKVGW